MWPIQREALKSAFFLHSLPVRRTVPISKGAKYVGSRPLRNNLKAPDSSGINDDENAPAIFAQPQRICRLRDRRERQNSFIGCSLATTLDPPNWCVAMVDESSLLTIRAAPIRAVDAVAHRRRDPGSHGRVASPKTEMCRLEGRDCTKMLLLNSGLEGISRLIQALRRCVQFCNTLRKNH